MGSERLPEYDILILAASLEAHAAGAKRTGAEQVAALSGVPKSTVYRRLESLKANGFLAAAKQRDDNPGRPQEVFTPTRKAYDAVASEAVRLAQEASRLGAIINSLEVTRRSSARNDQRQPRTSGADGETLDSL